MKTVTINVTRKMIREAREDISSHEPRSACCPIARAIRAAGYPKAVVSIQCFSLDERWLARHRLSRAAEAFVEAFDAGRPVKPARFRLTIGEK